MATFCVAADEVPTREPIATAKTKLTVKTLRLTTSYLRLRR
ncbi:MAG TPA: hypothetical protein VMZ73_02870 [Acidimicrobiales bacterium]|nr:hypothetical protein [Acidimicrobiales bacterium]